MAGTGEFDYEVDRLLDKRLGDGSQVEYLVRWKRFSAEWDTWEPVGNLGNCKQKIKKFEKERKERLASTQKIAKKLLSKSMARQDQTHTGSMKTNFKRKKKDQKADTQGKKTVKKLIEKKTVLTLDDVFEAVVNGTETNLSIKKSTPGKGKTPKSTGKTLVAKKIISTAKKKQHFQKVTKSGEPIHSKKLSYSAYKAKSSKTLKKDLKRKSDSDVLKAKRKYTKKDTSQKKVVKTKSWTEIDEEISFSSDEELRDKSLVKHLPNHKEKKPKSAKIGEKVRVPKLKNELHSKTKKELMNSKGKLKNSKLHSQSFTSTPKSAFTPVNKKKNQLKLSVFHLIGSKKKSETMPETNHSAGEGKDGIKVKKKMKTPEAKKRKLDTSDVKIETDMESDSGDEILYSLSDNSDLCINDPDSSKEHAPNESETNSGRSKSESSVGKHLKPPQKGKKSVAKKSKSTSEALPGKAKKIKLLDSLRATSPNPSKPVRPVSPTPVYTTVKHTTSTGSVIQSSQPLLAQAHWVLDDGVTPNTALSASLPISPASMSYKVLLENLPQQLHPKNKKPTEKEESDIERRVSIRASECAFKYKEIVIKKCQRYTQIWLNTHTKMKNALNPLVMQEISSALNAAKYDDSNLVVFSGLGNVFCSGIDLHYLTVGDKKVAARQMADALRDLVRKFITFPKLIVAVVTGPAIGMGSALLPLCDIVYASDKATFYMPYAQLSQTPEGCASFTLPNIVGIAMANELLVGGRKITAIEACQLGFVSQVYWPTSMMQEVIPRVQHMALGSGKVLETTKLLMRSHQRTKLDLTNESECNLLVERWAAVDCQKAIEEFLSNEKNYTL